MATMSTPCRFDDNDYKNWLKCSVALIHFKEGLHEYIDKEVNNLHADIHNTISAKLVGTSVQNQCYTCTWQDIKWNKGTWRINCQSQICDKWLSEILAKHTNPQNRNINWKNADITRWPADPYEVAKVYMPKGLDRTKNHPQDFDAPAVLSLLKYCVWFSQMIPNYNIVTDLIDFRNEVMHSGDLRITDFKKDNCIDIMTQLLTDLNIHGDVLTELQKIKREDIDINYRETEVRALRGLVHQLKDDHNTAIEEVKGNTMETRVTTETNFQVLEAKVEQLTEQYQNIKSFLANNLDIDDKDISDNIHVIEKEHQELETNIASVERRTDTYVAEIEDKKKTKQSPVLEESDMNRLCNELLHRYKSFRTLPFSDKDEAPLDLLYTEVVIKIEDKHKAYDYKSSHKETSIGNDKEDTQLTSYKNIFNSGKRTILTGPPGSGKSTFCRKIVNAWCKLKENKKIETCTDVEASLTHKSFNVAGYSTHHISNGIEASTHDSSEVTEPPPYDSTDVTRDENVLLKFDLLFYINSCAISNETKLIDVICDQCIQREQKRERDKIQETISKLVHAQPEKILIIFDGLDETRDTPNILVDVFRRDLYPEISVLMGMRPSRISKLDLKSLSHYDLLIHIEGFSTDNALKFVQKVIDMNISMYGETKKKFLTKKDREILISFKHTPLLLQFLAQRWYSEQCLPHKYKDLLSQIIAYLITRSIKKAGNKCTVNMSEESMEQSFYQETCVNACKVAYLFLLERGNGQSDKIPQKKLVRELGKNSEGKLNILLDCGIISKVDVSEPEMNVSVTFLHMSIQEYLVSIYLVRNKDAFNKFLRSIKTVNDIFRYENLFLFISGLNAMKGQTAFTRICEVCDEDIEVIQYRQGGDNYEVIQKLNAVYRKCVTEIKKQRIIKMPDIYITNDTDYKLLMSTLKSNLAKSLYLGQMRCDELDLNALTSLISLRLERTAIKYEKCSKCIHLCNSINSFATLNVLYLYHIKLDDGVLDLRNLTNLTNLKLYDVTMSEECSRCLCRSIVSCTCLEMLFLDIINLHDGQIDLSPLTSLISLTLKNITMSWKCKKYLYSSISSCAQLKKLHLCQFVCDLLLDPRSFTSLITLTLEDITMSDEYSKSLSSSISRSAQLENLHLKNIILHGSLLDLKHLTNLKTLRLQEITISNESCGTWNGSINIWAHLQILNLSDLTLQDGIIDLRSSTNLLNLTLRNITMSETCSKSQCSIINSCTRLKILLLDSITLHYGVLDLRSMTSLAHLTLLNVTMSGECGASLCSSISDSTSLKDLNLNNITLHDGVLDLTSPMNLTNLTMDDVIMSEECRRSVCSSISSYAHLQKLHLKNIKLHDSILHLRSKTNINSIRLDTVTMSEECSRSLFSSLSRCTDLIMMKLKNISLHDGVLALSSLTSLTSLTLDNVTMLDRCIISLCSSIRGCFCLEHLYMENIKLYNGVLDLGSLTEMNSLRLNNVTMCDECSKSLCRSISGFDHLEKLHLKSIKLHDGVLDLRSLTSMKSLRIENVTMAEECCTSLCSSIGGYAHMEKLHLKSIKLHDGVLDLRSLTSMKSLRIENVTMAEECYRSLCSSISRFTHLKELYLEDINLHYGVLDLRSQTSLYDLTLLHLTMSEECSRCLCHSICGYAQLEKLNLKGIKLHDGVLDLSTLTNLTEIILDQLSMSEKCSRSLCSSIRGCTNLTKMKFISLPYGALDLSSRNNLTDLTLDNVTAKMTCSINCTSLVKLYLHNIELHDSILDLSNISNLTDLKLDNVTMQEECSIDLCNYISHCTSLEKLYLCDIILHGIFDMGSQTNLTDLTLDNVDMQEECSISLCDYISGCTCLKNICLYNIKLNDGVLDMSLQKHIRSLRVCQLTMSDTCIRSLCSSISIFTQLKTMELKCISLHVSVLDLSLLTNMTQLTMDDVIMSEDCSRSLFSSLSRCTDLIMMKLKNISLHDGVLDLSSLTSLTSLTLDNVTMLDRCIISLCSSIRVCFCLEHLYLKNIKLHNGVLDLGSLHEMNSLRLNNVTMTGVCSKSLCSSISDYVHLEKLHLKRIKLHDGVLDLRSINNMNSLKIDNVTISDRCSTSLRSSITNFTHLEELYMDNIMLDYGVPNLRSLTNLKDLTLICVTMHEECSRSLCSVINDYGHLEKLHLKHIKLHDAILHLRSLTKMNSLRLDTVTMSEECSRSLCSCISSFTHLEELYLEDIKLHYGRPDLRFLTNLKSLTMLSVTMSKEGSMSLCDSISFYVRLENLNLKNINLHDGVLDLKSLCNLTSLTLDNIAMLAECIISFCNSVSCCACLEKLYLHNITLDEKLDLSSIFNLTDLTLNNVIMYDDNTMSLYSIIHGCTCLMHLCLENLQLDDGVLEGKFLTTLNSIRLCNVTMSKKYSRSLCGSISIFTQLRSIELVCISLYDGVLCLNSLNNMTHLTLAEVNMSEDCSRSLCSSLSRCTDLIMMKLKNISLHDGVLALSSLTSLTSLTLDNVTMLDKCIISLCSSIRGCFCLEHLYMENIKLHNGVLDLGSLTEMNSLRLNNVTMCDECSKSLCRSISGFDHLEKLHLKSIKLHDGVLDLRFLNNMKSFKLDGVNMSKECCRSLCFSISSFTYLQELYLEDITLNYGVSSLRSLTNQNYLTLLDVTMSEECRSLCSVISGYAHLEKLHLKNINLHDGVLNLRSLTNMNSLRIHGVIMSEECCRYLCSSFSTFTHLDGLYLNSITLHFDVSDLEALTNLKYLTLVHVKMSEECSRSLCSIINGDAQMKELHLKHIKLHDGVLDLRSLTTMSSLRIDHLIMSEECCRSLCSSINSFTHLEELYLKGITIYYGEPDLRSLSNLKDLALLHVILSEGLSRSLCSIINDYVHLEKLHLKHVKLHDGVLDLRSFTNMNSLILDNVTMSDKCCRSLCVCISSFTQLEELYLEDIKLHCGILDLRSLTKLSNLTLIHVMMSHECSGYLCHSICEYAQLEKLTLTGIELHDGVLDLSSLTNLTEIILDQLSMSEKCSRSLCSSIRGCTNLTKMKFVSLHYGALDLSSRNNLTDLTLDNVTVKETCSMQSSINSCTSLVKLYLHNIELIDSMLDLSNISNLTDLTLDNVTMQEECSIDLCDSISCCNYLETLFLHNITLHGILNLSSLFNMTDLVLVNVTMLEECTMTLCHSIRGCTCLKSLYLYNMKLNVGVLDLRYLTNMNSLRLCKVTISDMCSRSLCSSISNFTHLKTIELKYISLHDGVLDLSSLTSLTSITLDNVTMLDRCIISLCSSIRGCFCLEHLYLENIKLHNGVLDLGSLTEMNSLRLNNVTMCDECSKSLCRSISGFDHLEKLHLKSIKLHDGVLDLRSLTSMKSLRIQNVTMDELCCRSLCSSISRFTQLKELYLEDFSLHYGLLDLRSQTSLYDLTLLHLTMSDECSKYLCHSICDFPHLENLHLKGIKLYDGVLDVSTLTNLSEITLEQVIMSEECCISLCSSIRGCTNLTKMKLKFISLHNGTLDLSSLSNLTDLTLDNVTVKETCSMQSSINSCTSLVKLYLHNIELHDSMLDLSNISNLTDLTLDSVTMQEECSIDLCNYISHCTSLEKLYLCDIILHGIFDMGSQTNLTDLTLDNVDMQEECSISLCDYISGCTCLKNICLYSIKLNDGVLDMSLQKDICSLRVCQLTMSDTCIRSLCSSINIFTQLKTMELKYISLHVSVLDLSSLTNMTQLTLDDVIMSEDCSRSLCSSLSRCTDLIMMKLKNISLHDGVLDLSSLTKLNDLMLENVTMLEECSITLCRSISFCTCLKNLYLYNIQLYHGIIDLTSLTNLSFITFDQVSMSDECKLSLENSSSNVNICWN